MKQMFTGKTHVCEGRVTPGVFTSAEREKGVFRL